MPHLTFISRSRPMDSKSLQKGKEPWVGEEGAKVTSMCWLCPHAKQGARRRGTDPSMTQKMKMAQAPKGMTWELLSGDLMLSWQSPLFSTWAQGPA